MMVLGVHLHACHFAHELRWANDKVQPQTQAASKNDVGGLGREVAVALVHVTFGKEHQTLSCHKPPDCCMSPSLTVARWIIPCRPPQYLGSPS